ncbi:MAG: hypothetical protein ACXVCM_26430 [Ktedonobacteraceae bacterium]
MLNELERVRPSGIGNKRSERSRATREVRQKRRKKAWVEIHIRANPHRAVLLGAPGTLLKKLFATAHKRD